MDPPVGAFVAPPVGAFVAPPVGAFVAPPVGAFVAPPVGAFVAPPVGAFVDPPVGAFVDPPVGAFVDPGETCDRGSVIEVTGFVLTSAEHEDRDERKVKASDSYRRNLRGRDLIWRRQNEEIIRTDYNLKQ